MIDKSQLRDLGWTEDLISEVTRISEEIYDVAKGQQIIEEFPFRYGSVSGNSMYFSASEMNTSAHIYLHDLKKG